MSEPRSTPSILLPLAILLVAAGGLFWFLQTDPSSPDARGESGAVEQNEPQDAPLDLDDATAELVGDVTEANATDRVASVAFEPIPEVDAALRPIEGHVVLPPGLDPDPTLQVVAIRYELSHAAFGNQVRTATRSELEAMATNFAGADNEDSSGSNNPIELGRARVAQDGSFRVGVDPTEDKVFLALDGRFLYMETAQAVDLNAGAPSPMLEPSIGAWLEGALNGPPDTPEWLAGVPMRIAPRNSGPQMGIGTVVSEYRSRSNSTEGGRFEFRSVPATGEYNLEITPEKLAAVMHPVGPYDEGQHVELAIGLPLGGALTGIVVDADRNPLPSARVWASLAGRFMGFDDRAIRDTGTDENGVFTLENLPPGPVVLRADHTYFLESAKATHEVVSGKTVTIEAVRLDAGRSIEGQVVMEDGSPCYDTVVTASFDLAYMAGPSALGASRGASTQTRVDENGKFVLRGLGAGPFTVRAETHGSEFRPSARAVKDGVRPGVKDLVLTAYFDVAFRGVVVDDEGTPVPNYTIAVARISQGDLMTLRRDRVQSVVEDETGAFAFHDLKEGTWEILVRGDGVMTAERIEVDLPMSAGPDFLVRVVRTATVEGTVLDPAGQPVAAATVQLDSDKPAWQKQMLADELDPGAESDADGRFSIQVPPGTQVLAAVAEGFVKSDPVEQDLVPGAVHVDVDLHLRLGGSIAGEVLDKQGEPVEGWMISTNRGTEFNTHSTMTDVKGQFVLENMLPGGYQVVAINTGGSGFTTTEDGDVDMGALMKNMEMTMATVVDGEQTWVTLGAAIENPVRVHGKVTLDGKPYAKSSVTFWPEGSNLYANMKIATVDSEGRYEIELAARGDYVVFVQTLPGGIGQQITTEYTESIPEEVSEHEQNFEVPLGRISGTVFGPGGDPAAGERITLTRDGVVSTDTFFGGQYSEISTSADGTYDLPGLRPGKYRLSAGGSSLWAQTGAGLGRVIRGGIQVREDEWLEGVDLHLSAPGTLRVTVKDDAGSPVPNATVFVRDANGQMLEPFSVLTTDALGTLEYKGVAPGEYTVTARSPLLATQESPPVKVPEDGVGNCTLLAEVGTVIWVRVLNGDGESVKGTISVTDSEDREITGMFGMADFQALYMEGEFNTTEYRLGPLPSGTYKVHASHAGQSESKRVRLRGDPEKRISIRIR